MSSNILIYEVDAYHNYNIPKLLKFLSKQEDISPRLYTLSSLDKNVKNPRMFIIMMYRGD